MHIQIENAYRSYSYMHKHILYIHIYIYNNFVCIYFLLSVLIKIKINNILFHADLRCSKACGLESLWWRFWRTCSQPGAGAVHLIFWPLWSWSCGLWRCSDRIRWEGARAAQFWYRPVLLHSFSHAKSSLLFAGHSAAAVAPVEAADAKDGFVHSKTGISLAVFFLLELPYDSVIFPAGAISYIPQLGKWNSLLALAPRSVSSILKPSVKS